MTPKPMMMSGLPEASATCSVSFAAAYLRAIAPQTAAESLPRLVSRGLRHLRIEFLDDDASSVGRIVGLYRAAIEGRRDPRTLWRELKASSQYGVTRGSLAVIA